jgi:hypothetical protein
MLTDVAYTPNMRISEMLRAPIDKAFKQEVKNISGENN